MTNQEHLITTPPEELRRQWQSESSFRVISLEREDYMINRAAEWAADQELEACIKWIENCGYHPSLPSDLRIARRPKPPSLKEQALEELDELLAAVKQLGIFNPPKNIRRALEALPND